MPIFYTFSEKQLAFEVGATDCGAYYRYLFVARNTIDRALSPGAVDM